MVDNGSTDGTFESVSHLPSPLNLRCFCITNSGPGAARNYGAEYANGNILIFLDADMIPHMDLINQYLIAHQTFPNTILIGRILASQYAYSTLFDRVTGIENFHDLGTDSRVVSFYHLTSGNFSIGLDLFYSLHGFDEDLKMTEDTDLGYRAFKQGIAIKYTPGAIGYHNHPKSFQQRCASTRLSAYWTSILFQKHPPMRSLLPIYNDVQPIAWEKDKLSLSIRKLGRRFLSFKPVCMTLKMLVQFLEKYYPNPSLLRPLYWKILSAYRVIGYREGLSEHL